MTKKKSLGRMSLGGPKNTPTAYFDELCQISSILSSGLEQEWIEFISNQADLQQRCQTAEGEVTRLRLQYNQLKSEKEASDLRLKHVIKQLAEEKSQKKGLEKRNEKLHQQINLIREIFEDKDRISMMSDEERMGILNRSILKKEFDKVFDENSMDLDSDQSLEPSFETLDESKTWRRKSRRSHVRKSEGVPSGQVTKKQRKSVLVENPAKDTEYMVMEPTSESSSDPPEVYPNLKEFKKANIISMIPEKVSIKSEATTVSTTETSDTEYIPSDTASVTSSTSESSVPNRAHHFIIRNAIKPEQCKTCHKRIGFSTHALKCKYCRMTVHNECRAAAPLPCVPLLSTPSSKQDGTLKSYVPKNPPHIPSILVRCIQEIELRGMMEQGLYRVNGSEKIVKELREKMLRPRGCPNLRKIEDMTVLTGVVKNFLLNLNDPLLTSSLSEEFKRASEEENLNYVYSAVAKLPFENCHTLAFLLIHLQKVVDSPPCKMTIHSIARIFGPTLVASQPMTDMGTAMRENKRCIKVIEQLLSLPQSYWYNMLTPSEEPGSPSMLSEDQPGTPGTPEMLRVQPGIYQAPTPNTKDTTFAQRMFGSKKRTYFPRPYVTETP